MTPLVVGLALVALRGVVAIAVLTTLVGGIPRLAQLAISVGLGVWAAIGFAAGGGDVPQLAGLAPIAVRAIAEGTLGAALGVAAAIPLLAAQAAGRLVDVAGPRGSHAYANVFGVLAAAVFVGIDGHALVIGALVDSFLAVPPAGGTRALAGLVPAAIQLAIPWLVTAAVVEVALGAGQRVAQRTSLHAPVGAAVPAALAMMTAALIGTLAVAIAGLVRSVG